jgi:hypothetical protein
MGMPTRAHWIGTPDAYSGEAHEEYGLGVIQKLVCIRKSPYKGVVTNLVKEYLYNTTRTLGPSLLYKGWEEPVEGLSKLSW